MQRSLVGLTRYQRAVQAAGQRTYASAAELAVTQDSPFLRFASPEPQPVTYGSILGQIPETQVRVHAARIPPTSQEGLDLMCTVLSGTIPYSLVLLSGFYRTSINDCDSSDDAGDNSSQWNAGGL